MLQETLQTNFQRLINFLTYSKNFIKRRNPIMMAGSGFVNSLKEMLTVKKKLKLAQYRLNYHRHQLHKMESLIAANNEHSFLRGRNFNEVR